MFLLAVGMLWAAPLYKWSFDDGENIDVSTGMTEFGRTIDYDFTGLNSGEHQDCRFKAGDCCNPEKMFEASPLGKCLRVGKGTGYANLLNVKLPKKISAKQGTVAFWICPEDWDGPAQGTQREFLTCASDGHGLQSVFTIYKNSGNNALFFLIGKFDREYWSHTAASVWNWKRGDWHFICASWSSTKIYLSIDGQTIEADRKPADCDDFCLLKLGGEDNQYHGGVSLMDELQLYDKSMTIAEMEALYGASRSAMGFRNTPMGCALGIKTPAPATSLASGDYSFISNMSFDISQATMDNNVKWGVSRDAENIYLACQSPEPVRPAAVFRRDGALWEDESVEFHLERQKHHWQFIFNETEAFYDSYENDPAWNAENVKISQNRKDGMWLLQATIPWSQIGGAPADGEIAYMTLARSGSEVGSVAMTPLLRSFSDYANFLKIAFDSTSSPVALDFAELPSSEGKFNFQVSSDGAFDVNFCAMEPNERKLYDKKLDGVSTIIHKGENVARDGIVSFDVKQDGRELAVGKVKYAYVMPLKFLYMKTDIEHQTLECGVNVNALFRHGERLVQRLTGKDGTIVREKKIPAAEVVSGKTVLKWDMTDLEPGRYEYSLLTECDGAESVQHHQYYFKPGNSEPWNETFYEPLKEPLPPWKTPVVNGQRLECLTQSFAFDGSLFPAEVTAYGKQLLDAPMALRVNGKILDKNASFQVDETTPLHVAFTTKAEAEGLKFTVHGVLEFDGWCRFALDYEPLSEKTTINDLAFVMPVAAAHSSLVSLFEPAEIPRKYMNGTLGTECEIDLSKHPVFWFGDADYGLFWGADSFRGTHLRNLEKNMSMKRASTSDTAVAVVKFVDEPFVLTKRRTIEFGIQPTPAKEPRKDVRRPFMLAGGLQSDAGQYLQIFNYHNPEFFDAKVYKGRFKAAQDRNEPFYTIYGCYYGISPFCPEWSWYAERWISSPPGIGQFKQDFPVNSEDARNRGLWGFACLQEPEFFRWQLYWLVMGLHSKEFWRRDYYFDMAYPRACDNELHGCGWTDDFGVKRMTYPLTANREFTKAIKKAMNDNAPANVLSLHASSESLPPVCCFADAIQEGEVFVSRVAKEESYYTIFTPELFQACYTGRQCGLNIEYGAQFCRSCYMLRPEREEYWRREQKAPEAVRAVRHFFGYCLLHAVRPVAGAGIYNEGNVLNGQMAKIGFCSKDTVFIPYWHTSELPYHAANGVMMSVYCLPDGRKLLVLLNDTDSEVKTSVTPSVGAVNLEKDESIDLNTIIMAPRELKLLIAEK